MTGSTTQNIPKIDSYIEAVLHTIDREREREIIARRYGLFDRRETLEQIGELLGITRERVRQLEKSVITKLKNDVASLPEAEEIAQVFEAELTRRGTVARISDLANAMTKTTTKVDQSKVAFLARLVPSVTYINENDHYYAGAALTSKYSEKQIREQVGHIVNAIKKVGEPLTIKELAGNMAFPDPTELEALASVSKNLATLNGRWGLIKWPMVNPKNIRDKIYVILYENAKHMHFNDIAAAISKSDFKRKNVTTQAIHNELIKDKRFVLVGRGVYALKEWGFKKGTVADVIADVLKDAGEPLHRDDIVKRVLKRRFVKETTILLNLQGKDQFKRVAKATYTLAEEPA